jgi:hypothetical protein
LAYLSAERLAFVEGRPKPDPGAINVEALVGSVLYEHGAATHTDEDLNDATV